MLIVYGKEKTSKKFHPMDMTDGVLVCNKIFASMFKDEEREELQKTVDEMNKDNPDFTFEIRRQD